VPEELQWDLFAAFALVIRYDKLHGEAEVSVTLTDRLVAAISSAAVSDGRAAGGADILPKWTFPLSPTLPRGGGGKRELPGAPKGGAPRQHGKDLMFGRQHLSASRSPAEVSVKSCEIPPGDQTSRDRKLHQASVNSPTTQNAVHAISPIGGGSAAQKGLAAAAGPAARAAAATDAGSIA